MTVSASPSRKSVSPSRKSTSASKKIARKKQSGQSDEMNAYRLQKQKLLMVWKMVSEHRHANVFIHAVQDKHAPNYSSTVLQ